MRPQARPVAVGYWTCGCDRCTDLRLHLPLRTQIATSQAVKMLNIQCGAIGNLPEYAKMGTKPGQDGPTVGSH